MAFDDRLASRVRTALAGRRVRETKMMGGLCFMVDGHMCVGVDRDRLMVRVGPQAYDAALKRRHAAPMDFTGRPLRGFVFVAAAGVSTARAVDAWVARALAFTATLPRRRRR